MTQLQHVFVRGLRFATEEQYRVRVSGGDSSMGNQRPSHFRRLPFALPKYGLDGDGGMVSALQCASLALETKEPSPRPLPIRAACSPEEILQILSVSPALTPVLCPWETSLAPENEVLEWLRAGAAVMVQWECRTGVRWATVTGVEVDATSEQVRVRALLLLDSNASAPWGCGYNVRIELGGAGNRDHQVSHHLTGERVELALRCLIGVRASSKEALDG